MADFLGNSKDTHINEEQDLFSLYLNSEYKQNEIDNDFLPNYQKYKDVNYFTLGHDNLLNPESPPNDQDIINQGIFTIPKVMKEKEKALLTTINKSLTKTNSLSNLNSITSSSNNSNMKKSISNSSIFNSSNASTINTVSSSLSLFDLKTLTKQPPEFTQIKRERPSNNPSNSNGDFIKYKVNSKSCSALTENEGNMIFKTTKIKKHTEDIYSSEGEDEEEVVNELDPMSLKLYKNRIAAKKSRQKRKHYIQELEDRVKYLESELETQKKLNENDNKLFDLINTVTSS